MFEMLHCKNTMSRQVCGKQDTPKTDSNVFVAQSFECLADADWGHAAGCLDSLPSLGSHEKPILSTHLASWRMVCCWSQAVGTTGKAQPQPKLSYQFVILQVRAFPKVFLADHLYCCCLVLSHCHSKDWCLKQQKLTFWRPKVQDQGVKIVWQISLLLSCLGSSCKAMAYQVQTHIYDLTQSLSSPKSSSNTITQNVRASTHEFERGTESNIKPLSLPTPNFTQLWNLDTRIGVGVEITP